MLAAFLFAQLERRDEIQGARQRIWERYEAGVRAWAADRGVRLPVVPSHCDQAWHMFYLLMPSLDTRQRLIARLKQKGILAVFHYLPLHLSPMGLRFGGKPGDCPVTEDVSDRLLRLPFYNGLTADQQDSVIETILHFEGM
jgi:dTDP-4-amino-4,6-dideoxygalactose transaminase